MLAREPIRQSREITLATGDVVAEWSGEPNLCNTPTTLFLIRGFHSYLGAAKRANPFRISLVLLCIAEREYWDELCDRAKEADDRSWYSERQSGSWRLADPRSDRPLSAPLDPKQIDRLFSGIAVVFR